jgi:hypothetical protein
MTRQHALNKIWRRLFVVLCASLIGCAAVFYGEYFGEVHGHTAILVFLIGNVGGYVSVHRGLGELNDAEIVELSSSWWAIVVPSFVGGVLALAMYFLFLSNILAGELFPKFEPHNSVVREGLLNVDEQLFSCRSAKAHEGVLSLVDQSAKTMADYAKLFFWSFVAGFNQKYVVDIINSVKTKP